MKSLKIKISPQTISSPHDGQVSGMSQMLSGGTNGDSIFTGMTVPVLLTQKMTDMGHYSTWDGNIIQKEVMTNFLYSPDPINNMVICVHNTSGTGILTFMNQQGTTFFIDWGDGTGFHPLPQAATCNEYVSPGQYTITVRSFNAFGEITVTKPVQIPYQGTVIPINPTGDLVFPDNEGSWSGTPASYEYLSDHDSDNTIAGNVSIPNHIPGPVTITGTTWSRFGDLIGYGVNAYTPGPVFLGDEEIGYINCNPCSDGSTGYTLGNQTIGTMEFTDLPGGTTIYSVNTEGLIPQWLTDDPLVKEEFMLKVSMQAEIQSNVFIERGKQTVHERIQRMGEVSNMGELNRYGYGYFKVNKLN